MHTHNSRACVREEIAESEDPVELPDFTTPTGYVTLLDADGNEEVVDLSPNCPDYDPRTISFCGGVAMAFAEQYMAYKGYDADNAEFYNYVLEGYRAMVYFCYEDSDGNEVTNWKAFMAKNVDDSAWYFWDEGKPVFLDKRRDECDRMAG